MLLRSFSAFIVAAAALAAAIASSTPAQAQEGTEYGYVDLVMFYEYQIDHDVKYSVQNNGTATAIGVSVSFMLEDLQVSESANPSHDPTFQFAATTITPIITDKETVDTTNQRFTWVIGNMPPGSASEKLVFSTSLHSGHTSAGRIGSIRAEASSFSPEPDALLDNNVKKFYSYADTTAGTSLHMRRNWLALLLSVDDLRPAARGDVNFDLTAENAQGGAGFNNINLIADASVMVELSAGLEFKSGWTPPSTFVKSGSRLATWYPPDTDTKASTITPDSHEIEIKTQLTSESLADIPLEERCITARVTDSIPPPSADYLLGSLKQCLGDDPTVVFEGGTVDLFTLEATAENDLELVIQVEISEHLYLRSHGIGRSENMSGNLTVDISPEKSIIQVKDSPATRGFVSDNNVTSMTWQTKGGDVGSGVEVRENVQPILDLGVNHSGVSTVWSDGQDKLTASGIGTASKPGTVRIFATDESFKLADADSPAFSSALPFGTGGYVSTIWVLHFGTLGTYELGRTYKGTHSTAGTKTTAEEIYTFHVGPIAELEVRDGGASPAVPAGQRAFTIAAVNNGPDTAPAAKVTLTGVPAGSTVGHISEGSYDAATGVWTIGELETPLYRHARGRSEAATLTLITSAAADTEMTATISNAEDYEVCIDSSAEDVALSSPSQMACTDEDSTNTWHTTPYYDYISGNNSAAIRAQAGTGAALPALKTMGDPASIIAVMWEPVETVNGMPVSHYQVQKLSSPWTTVADRLAVTVYVDMAPREDSVYRVRAVNLAGGPGPWSAPINAGGVAFQPGVTVRAASPLDVKEGGRAEYWVGLNGPPESDVTIAIGSGNPDITVTPQPLKFTTSNWRDEQKVTVHAAQDENDIPDQTRLTHTITSNDPAYDARNVADVTVHVTDDEEGKERLKVDSQYRPGGVCYRWLPERVNSMKVTRNNVRPSQYCRPRSGPGDKANNVEEYGGNYTGVEYRFGVTVPAGDTLDLKAAFEGIGVYPPAANVELYRVSTTYDTAGRNPFYSEGYYSPGPGTLMGSYDHSSRVYTASGLTTGLYRLRLHCPGSPGPNAVPPWDCVIGHHMYFDLIWGGGASGDGGGPSGDGGEASHARQWTEHHYAAGSPHRVRAVVNYNGPGQAEAELFRLAGSPAERVCQATGSGAFTLCERDLAEGAYLVVVYADPDDHTVEFQAADPAAPRLAGLSLDNIVLAFNPDTAGYAVQVPHGTAETVIRATTAGEGASVSATANGSAVNVGDTIALAAGENVIAVTVSGADGSVAAAYTITVTRAAFANEWRIYIGPDSGTRPAAGEEQIGQDVKVFVRCNGELRFNQETCPFEPGSIAFQIQADGSGPLEATHRDDFGGPRQPFAVGQEPDSDFTVALVNLRPGIGDASYVLTDADRQDLERYLDRVEHVAGAEYVPFVLLRNGSETLGQAWFQLKPAEGTPSASNRAPAFDEGANATREVAENSAAGVGVGAPVTATDPDGDALSYSLSGADAASFAIGADTGQIATIDGVTYDYETKASYALTVEAADPDGAGASIDVAVSLVNVNEAPAFNDGGGATREVAENSAAGVSVGAAVIATDPDGDALSYSLSGADAASFEIGADTGQITTIDGVTYDYETRASYALTVEAADGKGGTASIAVAVNLADVEEATPVTACFTDLGALSAAVEYAGAWDDDECRAHHQDSRGRYFQFTLSEETAVTITLTPESGGALYVSNDTPQNGWGTPPRATYEDRRRIRRDNGNLAHDGAHTGSNTVTLTLAAGVTYTVEAAGTADGGTFAISFHIGNGRLGKEGVRLSSTHHLLLRALMEGFEALNVEPQTLIVDWPVLLYSAPFYQKA